MLGDNLKIFVHGLPLDCEEHSLKDFLEGEDVIMQLKGETLIFFTDYQFFLVQKNCHEWALAVTDLLQAF